MADVLRISTAVASPLSLLGLVAALGYYFYSRRLKYEEQKLAALPPEERARAVDQRLSRYGIDGSNIARTDKARLIRDELEKRYRTARLFAVTFTVVFVFCFGAASFAFIHATQPGDELPKGLEHLENELDALKAREQTSNAMLELLIAKAREGRVENSTPAARQLLDEMNDQIEPLKEGQRVASATLDALIAELQRADPRQPAPHLMQLAVDWDRAVNPSDTRVRDVLADPYLSEHDKYTLVLMSVMNGMDRDIEEQARLVQSIQGSPATDVETLKLKRLIDKRSRMFDALRQKIDDYNQTAKNIIDSMGR